MAKLKNRLLALIQEKELAENRRIPVSEIADAVGVNEHTMARWVRNEVNKFEGPIIERICVYFKREVGDLLVMDWDAPETPSK